MKSLTQGPPARLILSFALPMMLGQVFQLMFQVVDSAIVGNYIGKTALAAIGPSFPIIFAVISLAVGISTGGTIVISQYFGAKDTEKVKLSIDTLLLIMFTASLLTTAIGLAISPWLCHVIGLPDKVIPMALDYLNVYFGGLIVVFMLFGMNAILRGLGDSRTPVYFIIFSTLINIPLDLLFVVQFNWGIAGAAWATLLANFLSLTGAIIYLNRYHSLIDIKLWHLRFSGLILRQSLRIGLPSGIQMFSVAVGMIALYSFVSQFGTNVLAAYTVAGRIDAFASTPAMIFASALGAFTGQNVGAGKQSRVRRGLIATLLIVSLIAVSITTVSLLFSGPLIGLFTDSRTVVEEGSHYLAIVSPFYIIFGAMFTVSGVMRGAGDTLLPMFFTMFSWALILLLAWQFSESIGVTGLWWAMPVGWTSGLVLSTLYYLTGNWKKKGVTSQSRQME